MAGAQGQPLAPQPKCGDGVWQERLFSSEVHSACSPKQDSNLVQAPLVELLPTLADGPTRQFEWFSSGT